MIATYPIAQYAEAHATLEPRHIWIDGNTIHVYIGSDILIASSWNTLFCE